MKVVMLLGRSTGGIGTHVAELGRELRSQGVKVVVGTDDMTADRFDLGPVVRRWWPRLSASTPGRFAALRRTLAGSDVVHAHGHQAGVLAVVTARTVSRRRRPPVVVTWHNELPPGWLGRLLAGVTVRGAAAVTGASSDLVELARATGARRAWLSPVPSPKVPDLLTRPRGIPAGSLVLTVSRVAPQKDLGVVVDAAARLRDRRPALDWVVVGEGDADLLGELEERAQRSGAAVRFVGAQPAVADWLARAGVLVSTSRWEARALVVQEAMAAGVPVVARAVGGLPDLLAGCGLLVPAQDGTVSTAQATADAVDRLLGDPALAAELSARGREVARTWPDGHDTAVQWLAWYERLRSMT